MAAFAFVESPLVLIDARLGPDARDLGPAGRAALAAVVGAPLSCSLVSRLDDRDGRRDYTRLLRRVGFRREAALRWLSGLFLLWPTTGARWLWVPEGLGQGLLGTAFRPPIRFVYGTLSRYDVMSH